LLHTAHRRVAGANAPLELFALGRGGACHPLRQAVMDEGEVG
jgi:hypothetical protein